MTSHFHQVVLRIGASDGVPINLAGEAPVRSDLRLHARGHGDLREPFQNLLRGSSR